ncbi:hypothetical protein EJ04DRAFT_566618 [Polyplosphaeria fusca]|uniref:Uncharacterized protein n=1 Tax=Polyplosphaeria fusca TaxID=682080 RepID=A0A9P4QV81_9PLEO|nr:hypothetical protein EJ04DRAFT_566618 [Polyplosphaeria fusca]
MDNTWLNEPEKISQLRDLKGIATGNARILYGSDRNRFYDIITCYFKDDESYGAFLICTIDGSTKALRKEISDCPVKATRLLVDKLMTDTGKVMCKFDVGTKFSGQQGSIGDDGIFEVFKFKGAEEDYGKSQDDLRTMEPLQYSYRPMSSDFKRRRIQY